MGWFWKSRDPVNLKEIEFKVFLDQQEVKSGKIKGVFEKRRFLPARIKTADVVFKELLVNWKTTGWARFDKEYIQNERIKRVVINSEDEYFDVEGK